MLNQSIEFLTLLKENNDKLWFQENKDLYEKAKVEFEKFTALMIEKVKAIDSSIAKPAPKDCIFRIFRDVRFSHDKTPYKTNFGAYVARGGGRKSIYGGYYLHLEPASAMFAGGIWMPQPNILKALRNDIFHKTDAFLEIVSAPAFVKHFGKLDEENMLKTTPKDFPKDFKHVDLLKYKSFTMSKPIQIENFSDEEFINEMVEVFSAMLPFNNWANDLIEDIEN
jgi:uncharacterized protein (TIGR02453 family)